MDESTRASGVGRMGYDDTTACWATGDWWLAGCWLAGTGAAVPVPVRVQAGTATA